MTHCVQSVWTCVRKYKYIAKQTLCILELQSGISMFAKRKKSHDGLIANTFRLQIQCLIVLASDPRQLNYCEVENTAASCQRWEGSPSRRLVQATGMQSLYSLKANS